MHTVNCSLIPCKFPNLWKISEVIPLLKDEDYEVASNNRPLSLLVIISKVCEKVVLGQFSLYLTENHRISVHQSGNRRLHSTEALNILVSDTMLDAIDKKMVTVLILLDLSKTFDSVIHSILLKKLLCCVGASPESVKWFKSNLSGRSQYMRIGSTWSSTLPITHGVSLLFYIYVNDLPSTKQSSNFDSCVDD